MKELEADMNAAAEGTDAARITDTRTLYFHQKAIVDFLLDMIT